MEPGTWNPKIVQGATYTATLVCKDSDGGVSDLTGYDARMQIRSSEGAPGTLLSLTSTPAAGIVITAGTGTIEVTITAAQTEALSFDIAPCDLELYDTATGLEVMRLVEGRATLSKEITR